MRAGTAEGSLRLLGFSESNLGNYVGFVFDGTARVGSYLRTGFLVRSFVGRNQEVLRGDPAFLNGFGVNV